LPHSTGFTSRNDAERDDLSRYLRLNGSPPSGRFALTLFRVLAIVSFFIASRRFAGTICR
jgi:hypothetical protein